METEAHPVPASRRWSALAHPWVIAVAIAAGTLLLYAQVATFEYIRFDDNRYVTDNLAVQRGLSWDGVVWAFTTLHASNWHPLTWLSHMLDVQLFGLNPGAHHAVSALLHAVNAALLFLVLLRMTGARGRSAFVAALFAVHPLHVESVAWIAERKDVLSTLFGFLALDAYVRYADRPRIRTYVAVAACFALSLLSKPMWVTLPALLLLIDAWPLQRLQALPALDAELPPRARISLRRAVAEKLPLLAISIASSAVTVVAQNRGGALTGLELPISSRVANALVAYVQYVGKTIWPSSLAVFYPHPGNGLPVWQPIAAALILAAISATVAIRARAAPWAVVGWCWFLGTLVPVIGIVQVGAQALADRYTYLPIIGLFIAVAWSVERATRRLASQVPVVAAALLAVGASSAAAAVQISHWATNETVFRHALAVTRDNALAHGALADGLRTDGRIAEALMHAREAVRLDPGSSRHWNNLAVSSIDAHLLPEAKEAAQRSIELNPRYAMAWTTLGIAEQDLGDLDAAADALAEVTRLAPADAQAWFRLGMINSARARWPEAAAAYEQAVRIAPNHFGAWTNLAVIYQQDMRTAEAGAAFEAATRADPGNWMGWRNLGAFHAKYGRPADAAEAFKRSLQLKPDDVDVLRRLGLAELALGAPAEAAATAAQLDRLDPRAAADLRARIAAGP